MAYGRNPVIFVAQKENRTVFLIGTGHWEVDGLSPRIEHAIRKASIVATEVVTLDPDESEDPRWERVFDARIERLAYDLKKERFELETQDSPELRQCLALRDTAPNRDEVCVASRNRAWIDRMMPLIDHREFVVVAVGVAHLVGREPTLPTLLRTKGFSVPKTDWRP